MTAIEPITTGAIVMIVEDEDAIRTLMRRILTRGGYEVLEAISPDHAIELYSDAGKRAALLLTDVVMPGMSGVALSAHLREIQPDLRVLFISGYTGDVMSRYGLDLAGDALLHKPFDREALLAAVEHVLAASAA